MGIIKSNVFKLALCAIIGVGIIYPTISFAGDDSIGFEFTIKPDQGNSRTTARYRETTVENNAWKVNVTESGEGNTALTTFWLELSGGTNVSHPFSVAEVESAKYAPAYTNASKAYVHLTAQNNNLNNDTYGVTGIWDEETGVLVYPQ
ncbi:DUF2712 domain-containing protein [Peribacillus frigoritolerans]|uniref:DUF2712 domain-containing protein n=1 Tax=Peribacillus frigoritolerans TaxID=450367 RepID=UPI00227FC6B0|nr:DUF2712 domain-containing protein [Peribacillus frigoritolerans]MCY8935670.1 DUF2712 domain-containing protein [Peribacillus frigoritolerans]